MRFNIFKVPGRKDGLLERGELSMTVDSSVKMETALNTLEMARDSALSATLPEKHEKDKSLGINRRLTPDANTGKKT